MPSREVADARSWDEGLRRLRVGGTILVVMAHAAIAYQVRPVRTILWPIHDRDCSWLYDGLFHVMNVLVMPLFFLVAGISAGLTADRFGAQLARRARRVLLPLVTGTLTILPITFTVWAHGLLLSERIGMSNLFRMKFGPHIQPFTATPAHLWFLEYLFLVSIAWCGVEWLLGRLRLDRWWNRVWQRVLASPWKPVWLALPSFCCFLGGPDSFMRPNNSFVPEPFQLLHYGWIYVVGVAMARVERPWETLRRGRIGSLVAGGLALGVALPMIFQHAVVPQSGAGGWTLDAAVALFVWCGLSALLGFHVPRRQAVVSRGGYASRIAFWVYLFHMPAVAWLQVQLVNSTVSVHAKFLLATLIGLAASMVAYEFLRGSRWAVLYGADWPAPTWRAATRWELARLALPGALLLLIVLYFAPAFVDYNIHAVRAGEVYRSAQLPSGRLERLLQSHGIRTVLRVAERDEKNPDSQERTRLCRRRGLSLEVVSLRADALPDDTQVRELVRILDQSPRPILIEGRWGVGRAALGAALARLLAGEPLEQAKHEFHPRAGQVGGVEHCELGKVLLAYEHWLARNNLRTDAANLRRFVEIGYRSAGDYFRLSPDGLELRAAVGAPRYAITSDHAPPPAEHASLAARPP